MTLTYITATGILLSAIFTVHEARYLPTFLRIAVALANRTVIFILLVAIVTLYITFRSRTCFIGFQVRFLALAQLTVVLVLLEPRSTYFIARNLRAVFGRQGALANVTPFVVCLEAMSTVHGTHGNWTLRCRRFINRLHFGLAVAWFTCVLHTAERYLLLPTYSCK